jgi:hypothetical protein
VIPFFVGYAMLVWYMAARYRRTVLAYGCALAGVALLVVLCYAHWLLGEYFPEMMIQGMQILMYPYTLAVGGVAVFIASLPRRYPLGTCPACGYDLEGLTMRAADAAHPACPECGVAFAPTVVQHRPSGLERENLRAPDVRVISTAQPAVGPAGEQDHARDQAEQDPANR